MHRTLPLSPGAQGKGKVLRTRLNSGMEKKVGKVGGGCLSTSRGMDTGSGLCFKVPFNLPNNQSIIFPTLPMKPFEGSEEGSDSPKVAQREVPSV